jgi:hypothetical protein
MERRGETIVESSVEARQGFLGRPVLSFWSSAACLLSPLLRFLSRVFSDTRTRPGPTERPATV